MASEAVALLIISTQMISGEHRGFSMPNPTLISEIASIFVQKTALIHFRQMWQRSVIQDHHQLDSISGQLQQRMAALLASNDSEDLRRKKPGIELAMCSCLKWFFKLACLPSSARTKGRPAFWGPGSPVEAPAGPGPGRPAADTGAAASPAPECLLLACFVDTRTTTLLSPDLEARASI